MTEEQQLQHYTQPPLRRHQGVLWKRRDVFKNKWRPRLFVLQPEEAVLTYYLLSRTDAASSSVISTPMRRTNAANSSVASTARGSITTPRRRTTTTTTTTNNNNNNSNQNTNITTPPVTTIPAATANLTNNASNVNLSVHSAMSEITTDILSTVSQNDIDYDVVPRGSIYLVGCQVSINDALSIPSEGLFAFTIAPPANMKENLCHLSARTEEARATWVDVLQQVTGVGNILSSEGMIHSSIPATISEIGRGEGAAAAAAAAAAAGDDNRNVSNRSSTTSSTSWKAQSSQETLFDNVPSDLAERIEQNLQSHLELCDDIAPSRHWAPIAQDRRDGVSAYVREDLHGRTMLKSTALIPHHPKQVMNLLLDSRRRPLLEANVAHSERLEVLNKFCFLDYYSYKAVWPTSPRDFAVVVHWQALQRKLGPTDADSYNHNHNESDNQPLEGRCEEALVVLAFSCPEADELKEPAPSHVRAKLHASFYLLRLIPSSTGSNPTPHCHLTRILSYDLGGSLPFNLANTVLMQQAGIPGILSKHLLRVEPTPERRLCSNDGPLSNERLIQDVLEPILEDSTATATPRRLNFDDSSQLDQVPGDEPSSTTMDAASQLALSTVQATEEPALAFTAIVLLAPVFLHHVLTISSLHLLSETFGSWVLHPAIFFLVGAFMAVRYIVTCSLGCTSDKRLYVPQQMISTGATVCSNSADLKGMMRFIGNKREDAKEQVEAASGSAPIDRQAEISVVHVVATALVKAMRNNSSCWNYHRVNLPALFFDGFYRYPSSKLNLSVALKTGRILTLSDMPQNTSIQSVANALSMAMKETHDAAGKKWFHVISNNFSRSEPRCGHCFIVLTKTDSHADNQTSSSADAPGIQITQCHLPDGLDVLVTVGGIRIQKRSSGSRSPRPVLSLSLAVNTVSVLDVSKVNALAEDLQKFIQFPELCDGV